MTTPTLSQRRQLGFTLIEVLSVLVLLGILAALAAPSLGGVISRSETRGALDRVSGDVAYARMLAVRNGTQVSLTVEGGTGYRIVVDPLSGTPREAKRVDLTGDYPGLLLTPGNATLSFTPRGLLREGAGWIKATRRGSADSLNVTPLGQVHRAY